MSIFNSYVKLPEGKWAYNFLQPWSPPEMSTDASSLDLASKRSLRTL